MKKISVIIPVYNTEKYLSQCLESILGQSHANLEVLCVNDVSTDGSREILRRFAERDRRVTVLDLDANSGSGRARNTGIRAASGEYFLFVDSDDSLPDGALGRLHDAAVSSGSQAVCGGLEEVADQGVIGRFTVPAPRWSHNPIEHPDLYIHAMGYHMAVLFDAAFLRQTGVLYKEGVLASQDGFFLFEIFFQITDMSFIPDIVYRYRVNPASNTKAPRSPQWYLDDFAAFRHLYECAARHGKIQVADIRFAYWLKELFTVAIPYWRNNYTGEQLDVVLLALSKLFQDFTPLSRLPDAALRPHLRPEYERALYFLQALAKGDPGIVRKSWERFFGPGAAV